LPILIKAGQFDQAISDSNKAIELNPNLAMAYVNRGGAYAQKGQFDHTISDSNKAIELNPNLAMPMLRKVSLTRLSLIATRP
jgi:Flp pilus assembly protein TadD